MQLTAKCGLGQSVANSFSSIVENFQEEMIY
jgi:[NiFe] hydrogenase diaphorase moiety large subunit